jgi:hypothetical protein
MDRRAGILPLLGVGAAAILLCYLLVAILGAGEGSSGGGEPATPAIVAEDLWGIRIIRVSTTGGGGMLDLRYEVVDTTKALAALAPSAHGEHSTTDLSAVKASPLLIDERSDQAIAEAHLHQSGRSRQQRLNPKPGVERFIMFNNTTGLIEKGDKVTLAIGDARVTGLVVQ